MTWEGSAAALDAPLPGANGDDPSADFAGEESSSAVSRWSLVLCATLAGILFLVDLATPRGVADGVPYLAVVCLTMWLPRERDTWLTAALCTVLIALRCFFSPHAGGPHWIAILNRAVTVTGVWVTAFLCVSRNRAGRTFALLVNAAPYAILITDAQGRIATMNPAVERMFGYRPEELRGRSLQMLLPRYRPGFAGRVQAPPTSEEPGVSALRKDGSRIPIEMRINSIKTGKELFVLTTLIDVTERKRAEEATIARNRELQTLIHVISHDLREPLRAIDSFSVLVRDRYQDRLDETGRDFLRRIILASSRLRRLLEDVVALSRVRHAAQAAAEVEGARVVDEALRRLQAGIEQTHARIQIASDLPRLRVETTWAVQAVYNLLSNALKFTRDGSAPEIEVAGYVPEAGDPAGTGLVVRDRGPGVAPEQRERIFELFQRGVGREVEGTGAGLAIVRAVAERSGGCAWARARDGGGSEFFVTFGES